MSYGITRLPDGRPKASLAVVAEEIFSTFVDHVLPLMPRRRDTTVRSSPAVTGPELRSAR
jgi:hypothetical protein